MVKLNKKTQKGIGLVEVICSMAILLILSSFIFSTKIRVLKINRYNRQVGQYTEFLASLKEYMYFNCTYDEIKSMNSKNLLVINKENLNVDSINDKGIGIFTTANRKDKSYLTMKVKEDERVLKIDLVLNADINNKNEVIKATCFKGDY